MLQLFYCPPEYRFPLGVSIALHIILLILISLHPASEEVRSEQVMAASTAVQIQPSPAAQQKPEQSVVNAVAVDQAAIDQQMNAIQAAQNQQHVRAVAEVKRLQAQAAAAKRAAALAEQQRLAQIKAAQLAAKKQQEAAAEQLQKQQQQLAAVKTQQEALKKQQQQALLEQQKKLQQQQALLDQQKKEQQAQQQKQQQQKNLAAQQQKLQQQMQQEQLNNEQQQLASDAMQGVLNEYQAKIRQAIQNQWTKPLGVDPNLHATFRLRLAPNGTVLQVELLASSGNSAVDQSAQTAIYKASPLPVPKDPAQFNQFRSFSLTMRTGDA